MEDAVQQIDTMGIYADILYFETHRDELATLMRNPAVERDMREFLEAVDVTDLVRHYSYDALSIVRDRGTVWDLTLKTKRTIERAVSAEWGKRNASNGQDRKPKAR